MKRVIVIAAMFFWLVIPIKASDHNVSISTDLIGYACLGTMNADVSFAISRNWSLMAGIRYNPFTFKSLPSERQFQLRQRSLSLGARVWPWHTASGWWMAGKLRYQEYNMGGIFRLETEEGDRLGAGFYTGYTHMLSAHFNLEFGIGVWAGMNRYHRYSCPSCGVTLSSGRKFFVLPDDIMVSVVYVF